MPGRICAPNWSAGTAWQPAFTTCRAQKAALDARIQAEGARLEQELVGLHARQKDISATEKALPDLLTQQQELNARQTDMETRLQELGKIEDERASAADKRADLLAEFNQKR